jgi:anti-sigma regulatory factor (Ser/Thr protein kinase)
LVEEPQLGRSHAGHGLARGLDPDLRADTGWPDAVISSIPRAEPSTVSDTRRMLVAFAAHFGARPDVLRDVAQAVTEAVANVVVHAYPPGATGPVQVVAEVADGALEVLVIDHGGGFRPGRSDGAGLGLSMIAAATARLRISPHEPSGTEIWMRFRPW